MVKHGSLYLRYILMTISQSKLVNNSEFYGYYLKKRNEGKAHWVTLSHLAKKLIRIIYKLEGDNVKYSSSRKIVKF